MKKIAMGSIDDDGIAAIVLPCSARKAIPSSPALRAVSVSRNPQAQVAAAWLSALGSVAASMAAHDLYRGRNFHLARTACARAGAPMFIISAGLGLVDGSTQVPSYGLTVSGRGQESVRARVAGHFSPKDWWNSVASSRFATNLDVLFDRPGRVLVALTSPYAAMVGDALAALAERHPERIRLFGIGLRSSLASTLASVIMPYDDRLDAILPGTRSDFAVRALSHFAALAGGAAASLDHAAVEAALKNVRAPIRSKRPRLSDDEIIARIRKHLKSEHGIQKTLRRLRHEDSIACEQARFTRLYHVANARGAAA